MRSMRLRINQKPWIWRSLIGYMALTALILVFRTRRSRSMVVPVKTVLTTDLRARYTAIYGMNFKKT
ncbi:MAG: hypothetical protein IIT46_11855 [Lachnospiraceae bacterium]|nr:hypothetical protein [Lachnospiraceae bacterium]